MATTLGEAFVRIRPDTSGIAPGIKKAVDGVDTDREGRRAGRRFTGGFGSSVRTGFGSVFATIRGAAGVAAGAMAAVGGAKLFTGTIRAASDLNESMSKVGVVFGDSSGRVKEFARTAATSLGQSRQQALEATGTFGNLLVAMKVSQPEAAKMSIRMTQLASDLASFNNTTPEEALEALRSGLVGETEPLKRFGVNLNAARIEQEAMRLGLEKTGGEFTSAAKAQAAYSLILQDSKTAQGDFSRTSNGLANQQRILAARFEDIKAKIGTALLPVVTKLATWVGDRLMPAVSKFFDRLKGGLPSADTFRSALDTLATVGERAWELLKELGRTLGSVFGPILKDIGNFVTSTVVPAFGQLGGFLAGPVANGFSAVLRFVRDNSAAFQALVVGLAAGLAAYKAFNIVQGIIKGITSVTKIWTLAQAALNVVMRANPIGLVIAVVAALVTGLIYAYKRSETFRNIVNGVFRAVAGAGKFMWENILKPVFNAFRTAFQAIGDAIRWTWLNVIKPAWDAIKAAAQFMWDNVLKPVFKFIVNGFLWLAEKIVQGAAKAFGWVPGLGPKLKGAADAISRFRRDANKAINGITPGKDVNIKLRFGGAGTGATKVNELLSSATRRATGGPVRGPGSATSDSILAFAGNRPYRLSDGEHVWTAREVDAVGGHGAMLALRQAVRSGAVGLKDGGGVSVRARTPRINWKAFVRGMNATIGDVSRKMGEYVGGKLERQLFAAPSGGGAGVDRWRGVALRALAYTGSPLSWIGSLLRRMNQESGGNPRAINLWDVNARRGDPSRGLMQTIGSTFYAYARELAGRGIYDPFANIVASIRYANARYGAAPVGWNRAGGYDAGGVARGVGLLPKLTPKPERVLNPRQTTAFERLVDTLDGGVLRVAGGRVDIGPGPNGGLEGWVRDLVLQESTDDRAFRRR